MKITEKSHPHLFTAFATIDHDSGRTIGRGISVVEYEVPENYEPLIEPAERALATMTEQERETVAIGEETEAAILIKRLGDDGEKLEELLAEFFIDWCAGNNPEGH